MLFCKLVLGVDANKSWDTLFEIMQDDTVLCTEESAPDTGMPAEVEVEFSRIFIPAHGFKVRMHTPCLNLLGLRCIATPHFSVASRRA